MQKIRHRSPIHLFLCAMAFLFIMTWLLPFSWQRAYAGEPITYSAPLLGTLIADSPAYNTPITGRTVAFSIPAKATVQIHEMQGSYYRIVHAGQEGWVNIFSITLNKAPNNNLTGRILNDVTAFSLPDVAAPPVDYWPQNTSVLILADNGEWVKARAHGIDGYISKRSIIPASTGKRSGVLTNTSLSTKSQRGDLIVSGEGKIVNMTVQHYSYDRMCRELQLMKQRFPDYVTLHTIGKTVLGRDIPLVIIGNPYAPTRIWVEASNHAREYMTSQIVMAQLELLLNNTKKGVYQGIPLSNVLDSVCLHVVPMLNPDGVELSQRGLSSIDSATVQKQVLALNGGSKNFSRWKANIRGIDLNCNFDAEWKTKKTTSSKPSPMGYKGPKPFSEPETLAVKNYFALTSFAFTISYHAEGSIIFWHFNQDKTREARDYAVAAIMGNLTQYKLIPKTDVSAKGGGLKDWAIQTYHQPGITLELGPTTTTPIPIQDFGRIYERNRMLIWTALLMCYSG